MSLRLTAVDVTEALRTAEAILRPSFMQREQSLSMELPEGPVLAVADARSMEQVLLNLLSNANRHTPARGSVTVRVVATGDAVRIDVQDSGPGIDPADRQRIFEPFYRVQRPGAAEVPGSGLGLAVSQRLTELQGGRLWVEEGAGSGSRFCVQLPAHAADRADASAEPPAALAAGEAHSGVR